MRKIIKNTSMLFLLAIMQVQAMAKDEQPAVYGLDRLAADSPVVMLQTQVRNNKGVLEEMELAGNFPPEEGFSYNAFQRKKGHMQLLCGKKNIREYDEAHYYSFYEIISEADSRYVSFLTFTPNNPCQRLFLAINSAQKGSASLSKSKTASASTLWEPIQTEDSYLLKHVQTGLYINNQAEVRCIADVAQAAKFNFIYFKEFSKRALTNRCFQTLDMVGTFALYADKNLFEAFLEEKSFGRAYQMGGHNVQGDLWRRRAIAATKHYLEKQIQLQEFTKDIAIQTEISRVLSDFSRTSAHNELLTFVDTQRAKSARIVEKFATQPEQQIITGSIKPLMLQQLLSDLN